MRSSCRKGKLKVRVGIESNVISITFFLKAIMLLLSWAMVSEAQNVSAVVSFSGQGCGGRPAGSLTQGRDGKLYGMTLGAPGSSGCFFRLAGGGITFPFTFDSTDGNEPVGGPTLAMDGNYYGVAQFGGASGFGTFFRISPTGTYTLLHDFGGGPDGANPFASPMQAKDGNIYGVTLGTTAGTLYRYTPKSGAFATIYTFDNAHGVFPNFLIQGTDGNLYGTASFGGNSDCGTLFKIAISGSPLWSYSFPCGTGGVNPATLLQASDGNFYGATVNGGLGVGFGTIFKLDAGGNVVVIYSFSPASSQAGAPLGLVQANDGNLYGTAFYGGRSAAQGSLFKLTTSGEFTRIYGFDGRAGGIPTASLVQDSTGFLYGTTQSGGKSNAGTVYRLDAGLSAFVKFVLPDGKTGQSAQIIGQGLTGTASVTFNGVPATSFKVVSDTYMTAVVPAGATTGPVVVATPGGKLTSNVSFRITK